MAKPFSQLLKQITDINSRSQDAFWDDGIELSLDEEVTDVAEATIAERDSFQEEICALLSNTEEWEAPNKSELRQFFNLMRMQHLTKEGVQFIHSDREASLSSTILSDIRQQAGNSLQLLELIQDFPNGYQESRKLKALDDALTLLLITEKERSPLLNGKVINIPEGNFSEFESYIDSLQTPGRYQIIVGNRGHYTACDVCVTQEPDGGIHKKAIVLDAAGDARGNILVESLRSKIDTIYFSRNGLQKDTYSCPLFSLDHACQLANSPDIYTRLNQEAPQVGVYEVDWKVLPPPLVWNAQSFRWINDYQQHQSDASILTSQIDGNVLSFNDYIESGTDRSIKDKPQNKSIEIHVKEPAIERATTYLLATAKLDLQHEYKRQLQAQRDSSSSSSMQATESIEQEACPQQPDVRL